MASEVSFFSASPMGFLEAMEFMNGSTKIKGKQRNNLK